ncbi:MAG TPA: zf-TFIIB domain-containing protein [Fimbriimonadaceae bacterium]|nr:zf-TFIIB domain-containing protein [Fimbriimonadaceae bacterium]
MRCPRCEVVELTMADRSGVEIDYCRACRGVWLDKDELDKIIDRVAQSGNAPFPAAPATPTPSGPPVDHRRDERKDWDRDRDRDRDRRRDDDDDDYRGKRRRGGFLENIFDVFD